MAAVRNCEIDGSLSALAERISRVPGVQVNLHRFPSGAATLDVVRDERLYVLDYSPTRRFGVDEVKDGEGFLISYGFTSEDYEPAAKRLWELVAGIGSAPVDLLAPSRGPQPAQKNGDRK